MWLFVIPALNDLLKKFGDLETATRNWEGGLATETEHGDKQTFVARLNGEVVGYTSPGIEDGQRRLGALYVTPDAQGHGVGSRLLQTAIDWHGRDHDIFLHVVSHNQNAISFYEHHGFQKTGEVLPAEFDAQQGIKLLEEYEMVLKAQ